MKKFLSLVLALVMTMSLVTVSAGAKDFTDGSEITYKEAVDVISALGVVDGYSDGDFRPDDVLTRGAAAKIICNLILGPTTASALAASTAPFKDVPVTNTFAGYITYCSQQGIISGYADGTFRPTGTLSGNAFMKMLLGALGYDSSIEGYTGPNWQVSVIKQASGIGLDDGNDEFVGSQAVTRQEAALYAFNMLQATMVEYDKKDTIVVGGVEITSTSTRKEVENPIEKDNTIEKDEKMQFAERYFDDLQKAPGEADDFGRPSNIWTLKSDEIGTYANMDQLVGTYTAKVSKSDVYEAVGRTVYNDLTDGKSDLTVWFDGVETPVKTADVEDYVERNNTGAVNNTANGDLTEIYVDDDTNDVTIVTVRTYVFQAASDYDTRKETVSLTTDSSKYDTDITLDSRTLDVDDFANITDLKADDYVLVTAVNNNSRYEVKSIDKAEVVNGTVEGYKDGSNVTMGGTKYEYSATADNIKKTSYNVGREASLVLDSYGYVIAVDESVVLSDYVYIAEFGSSSGMTSTSRAVAYAIFPDGTAKEIVVDEAYDRVNNKPTTNKSDIKSWGTEATQIGWFTYSVNSADEYTLYNIESKYTRADGEYKTAAAITVNSRVNPFEDLSGTDDDALKAVFANDDTIVIVNDVNDDLSVYTGVKNFPAITKTDTNTTSVYTIKNSSGYAALVYIDVNGNATISGDKSANLVYVLSYDGKYVTTDNETYYQYTVLDGDAEVDVIADRQIQNRTGDVYQVANYLTRNNDDQLTDFALVSAGDSGVVIGGTNVNNTISQSAGTLSIGGKSYLVTADTKITLVTPGDYASIMNKDEDADYEVAANMTAKELVDALKGYTYTYDFGGKVTENQGNVISELYVTIKSASVAVADDASLSNFVVKNMPVSASRESGVDFEVTVPIANNVAGTDRISFTKANASTTVTAVTASTVAGLSSGTSFALDQGKINSIDNSGAGATIYVQLTATMGSDTQTYVIKITGPAASTATLAVKSGFESVVKVDTGVKAVKVLNSVNATVQDLYNALEMTSTAGGESFRITNAFGSTLATDSTTAVATGMKVVTVVDGVEVSYAVTTEASI